MPVCIKTARKADQARLVAYDLASQIGVWLWHQLARPACGNPWPCDTALKIGGIPRMKSKKSAGEDTKPGCRSN